MTRYRTLICLGIFLLGLPGCTGIMKRITLSSSRTLIADSIAVINSESDLTIAEAAITGNLELLTLLVQHFPRDRDLLVQAAQAFGGYAFAFVEEEMEQKRGVDETQARWQQERAKRLYLRARDYGWRALRLIDPSFPPIPQASLEQLQAAVAGLDKEAVPALFWTAYAWANWINLERSSLAALAQLPKAEVMMRRVLALDDGYFHAGPHLFFAIYYGGRSRQLGGDPERARFHFERALELTRGRYLLVHVFYARFYAVQVQDRSLYVQLLQTVLEAPDDLDPRQRLANQLAKQRARRYLQKVDELFG
ncbi:MAG: hypothetical protein D6736_15240 [Nitrospinota bacterium]|nr:MAG: hypothetical protein D6736_15240 [Nitrospinota bacterium]